MVSAACFPGTSGLFMSGELPKTSDYAIYVGKFCYDYVDGLLVNARAGRLTTEVTWDAPLPNTTTHGKLYMLLFDDEQQHWRDAHKNWDTSSCAEKKRMASFHVDIDLYSASTRHFQTTYIKEHLRPRFWYMTFVACGIPRNTPINFSLHSTNEKWGWQQEFSYDRIGILPFLIVYFVAILCTTLAIFWATTWRREAQEQEWRKHPYIRLLWVVAVASSLSCGFYMVHYFALSRDGVGYWGWCLAGIIASSFANCAMLLIAALSGLGWLISGRPLQCRRRLFGAVGFLGIASTLCEIHSEVYLDESTRLYAQESPVGLLVMLSKALLFCWVIKEMRASLREEWLERLRNFYKAFGISFACWSLSTPIIVVSAFLLKPWFRFKVVMILEHVARLAGLALLGSLFAGPLSPILLEKAVPNSDKAAMFGTPMALL